MSETLHQQITRRKARLWTERSGIFSHWQELSEQFQPRRGRFLGGKQRNNPKRNDKILNGSPLSDVRIFGAGLMSNLANPGSPWFRTTTPDPDLAKFHSVRGWLFFVEERLRWLFELARIYSNIHSSFIDDGIFGTSAIHIDREDPKTFMRGYNLPIGQYALAADFRQQVDTCYREISMTVGQLVRQFGRDACSQRVREMYDRRQLDEWVDVIHAVEPNPDHEPGMIGPSGKAWRSIWIEAGGDDRTGVLREAGFDVFPVVASRWETNGEDVYGSNSPGMEARGDAKGLQYVEGKKSLALDLILEPPLVVPAAMRGKAVGLLPGDVTTIESVAPGQEIKPAVAVPYQTLEAARLEAAERAAAVRRAFMVEMWLSLHLDDGVQKTAREVAARHEERLVQTAPAILRMMDEKLRPLIEQGFATLLENGLLPPPPEELQGQELRVEFTSPLAQALKLVGVAGIERFGQFAIGASQLRPDVLDKVNFDAMADTMADALGVPPTIVNPEDVVAQIRQERAAKEQAQQQGEAMLQAAQGAQALAGAQLGNDSVLDRLLAANGAAPPAAGVA